MGEETANLLGQLAIQHGLITPEQLEKSLAVQRSGGNSPLGQILKDLGYLDASKLRFLEEHQTKTIRQSQVMQRPARADILFAKLVQQRCLAGPKQVSLARERKAVLKTQGQRIALGQVMVDMGFLTGFQLATLHAKRKTQLLFCAGCDELQRVFAVKDGFRVRCDKCHTMMRSAKAGLEQKEPIDTWFIEERGEFVGYLGRTAIKGGYLDQEQVVRALQHQVSSSPEKSLGDVFLELGFLDAGRLAELRAESDRLFAMQEERRRKSLKRSQFGEAAMRLDFTDEEFVKSALAVQAKKGEEGLRRRLGMILVDRGDLTAYQLARVLEAQGKRIGRCPKCSLQYNVAEDLAPETECPSCHQRLEILEEPESLEIHEDLVVGPSQVATIDLGDTDDRFPVDDTVRMATRTLRRFYKEVGLLDEVASESSTPTSDAKTPTKRVAVDPTSRFEERRAKLSEKAVEARTRKRWTIPIVAASVLVGFALVSVVGYFATRTPPEPWRRPDEPIVAPPPPPVELADGVRIEAYGQIPPGKPKDLSDVREDRQAFLFELRPGETFWAVDLTGASYDRLQFLGVPSRETEGSPVRIRAAFASMAPAEFDVPVLPVKGWLVIEEWQVLHAASLPPVDGQRLLAAPEPAPAAGEQAPEPPPGG